MTYSIRNFKRSDYPMLEEWAGGRFAPLERIPEESSFVLMKENMPAMAITLIMTNTDIAWMENLIGNPKIKNRPGALRMLVRHLEQFAKMRNKKTLFLMSARKGTDRIWKSMDFQFGMDGLKTFVRGI